MAWIESHQTLGQHPKTRKLAHLLGVSKPTAIGHLHCLWWWAVDYAEDGGLARFDDLDIAIGAEWEGDESEFVTALVKSGFIDQHDDGSHTIHDWDDYAGKLIERKKANAERMRDARAKRGAGTNPPRATHVQRTQRARAELPNQTIPNQTEPGDIPPSPPSGADAPATATDAPKRSRKKPSTTIPDDFTLTPQRLEHAIADGLSDAQARHEFKKFQLQAVATDRRQVDWDAAWRQWILGAVERYGTTAAASGPPRASPAGRNIETREDTERRLRHMREREAATT